MACDGGDKLLSSCRANDDGDILGVANAKAVRVSPNTNATEQAELDTLVDSQPRVRDGIFAGLDTESLSEQQLDGLLEVMSMNLDMTSVKKIVHDAGAPRLRSTSIIPKMVSEACKVYLRQLIELSLDQGIDIVQADAILEKKYRL